MQRKAPITNQDAEWEADEFAPLRKLIDQKEESLASMVIVTNLFKLISVCQFFLSGFIVNIN